MSNNQPQKPRQSDIQRNRRARRYEAGDYQSEQFENDQQHAREPRRETHDFRREEVYGRDNDWNQGESRDYTSRSEGNYPDYEAMNSQRQYAGSDSSWPWNSSQQRGDPWRRGARPSQSATSNYWQPQGSSPNWQNNPSRQSDEYFAPSNHSQADYGFGNPQSFGAGSGFNQGAYRGRAPKGYQRSDERVREDICERLSQDAQIDASEITVTVKAGIVTLEGSIEDRQQKHRVEDIADACSGVKDVQNRLTVSRNTSLAAGRQAEAGQQH